MDTIAARVTEVQERIWRAAERAGRRPEDVTLVAVTKTWPAAVVLAGYEGGLRHFGENRVEELGPKRAEVEAQLGPDSGIVWHLIGTLQSRKTKDAADAADVFHALDRLKIANRLAARLVENGRRLPVFLEVNVSGETSKSGFDCRQWEDNAGQREMLRAAAENVLALSPLALRGLMTMTPWDAPPEEIRSVFRRARLLAEWLASAMPSAGPLALSMGMSDDYEIAIEEGATHVRIGRALFGPRNNL